MLLSIPMDNKLKKNLAYNIIYQILILFLPLVTSSYLARKIGAEGIGRYTYSYSIALYFTYFTLLGLKQHGNREIAASQNNREKRSKRFWELYVMQMACFGLCFLAYIVYVSMFSVDRSMASIQTIFVLSSLFDINWFFWGMEMVDKTVIRNTVVKLLTTVAVFAIVREPSDVEKYAAIMAVSYLISQLALWPYLKKIIVFKKVRYRDVRTHIMPNLTMFLPVIVVSIYNIMDKIMLGIITSKEVVGYYENAERIISVPGVVVGALGNVMLPRVTALISEKKDQDVKTFRDVAVTVVSIFTVGSCFGIIGISDILSLIMWGEGFEMSGIIMKYLAITLLFSGMANVIRTQFLIPYKYDQIYIISAFLGAVVNVIVNLILIPHYGAVGAAIGTICAEFVVCFYQLFMIRSKLPLFEYLKNIVYMSIAGIIMLMVIRIMPVPDMNFIALLLYFLIGGILYLLLTVPVFYSSIRLLFKKRDKNINDY